MSGLGTTRSRGGLFRYARESAGASGEIGMQTLGQPRFSAGIGELLPKSHIEGREPQRAKEALRVEVSRPDIQRNFVDPFGKSSLLHIAHQSRANSATSNLRHYRDVMHIDTRPRGVERRFLPRLNLEPDVSDSYTFGRRNPDH